MADEGHVPTNAADTPSAMLQPMQPVVPVTSALPDAHVSQAQSQAQVSAGVPAAVVGALPVFPSASGATAGTTGSFPASVSMPALAPMGLGAVGNPALAPSLLQGPVGEAWLAGGSNAAALANFAQMGSRKAPYYEDTDRPRG